MGMVNKVEVIIDGQIITLVSGEDENYIQKLARYIDHKLSEIKDMKSNASLNERMRSLFIAINIADDYFKVSDELRALSVQHDKFISELGRMQEENLLLREKIYELQNRLNQPALDEPPGYPESHSEKNIVDITPHSRPPSPHNRNKANRRQA